MLLQGFLTSAQNMMLLFMQVNLFSVATQRQRAGQGNLHRYDTNTDPRDSERHLVLAVRFKAQLWNIHTLRRHVNVKTRSRPLQPYQQITSVTHTHALPHVLYHDVNLLDADRGRFWTRCERLCASRHMTQQQQISCCNFYTSASSVTQQTARSIRSPHTHTRGSA